GLRESGIADHTLVWFCSDNGGLPGIEPGTVGDLRGFKNTVFEGGLRVPAIIEWPQMIREPRVSSFPAATMDIFPTLAAAAGLPDSVLLQPQDGISLMPLLQGDVQRRDKPICFRHTGRAAIIDNDYKLLTENLQRGDYQLYDLADDPQESN